MDKKLKLYCFAESGNAYKAALFLRLGRIDWTPIFVDFFKGETRSVDFRKINSMGEVPVLVDQEKQISQSGAILLYLSKKTGLFIPKDPELELEVTRWLLWDNYKLTPNFATGRFMSLFLPEDKKDVTVIEFLLGRLRASLKVLNEHLENKDFIVGEHLTIADLSIAGYIYFTDELDFDLSSFPNVVRWKTGISDLEHWKHPYDLMPKNSQDKGGDKND